MMVHPYKIAVVYFSLFVFLQYIEIRLAYSKMEKQFAAVYWNGEIGLFGQMISLVPVEFLIECGCERVLSDSTISDFVPWPNRSLWQNFPFIKGRILKTGG